MDDRHRKFYIGDTFGNINLYNASSGVHITTICDVVENLNEQSNQFDGNIQITDAQLNKISSETTSLNFVSVMNSSILIASTWDSKLHAFETEESDLLRESIGKNKNRFIKDEDNWMRIITTVVYNDHLGLVATGSNIGKIAVWDLESFKIEAFLKGNLKEITSMAFIPPYPLLVAGCGEGTICIYGVRGIDVRYKYTCL